MMRLTADPEMAITSEGFAEPATRRSRTKKLALSSCEAAAWLAAMTGPGSMESSLRSTIWLIARARQPVRVAQPVRILGPSRYSA